MELAPLTGRRTRLRAVLPSDYEYLYMLMTHPEVAWRWRNRGIAISFDAFVQQLWAGTLVHFVIERKENDQRLGYVQAFDASERHGWCHIAALLDPSLERGGWAVEAPTLFLNYVFATYNFRKLYAAVAEFNLDNFASAAGRAFQIEGRLEANEWHDGQWWDLYLLALYRRDWDQYAPLVAKLTQPPRVPA